MGEIKIKDTEFILRPELHRFSQKMERRLIINNYKGGWDKCSLEYLLHKINVNFNDLKVKCFIENLDKEYQYYYLKSALNDTIDIANYSMMIFDNLSKIKNDF